jgi:ferredoxin-NADP reductase/Na+-transporting NADH:ubiquinone oxidoreductase subunit NqrB
MLNFFDSLLDRITMYRLVLYGLIFLLVGSLGLSQFGKLPFTPAALLFSTGMLLVYCWLANSLFAKIFRVTANVESVYITALILALIIQPPNQGAFLAALPFLIWASVWAMAAKFIVNIGGKHIFNPAAFAVAMTALTMNQSATWWIGGPSLFFLTIPLSFLIIRKVRRFDMVLAFLGAALLTMVLLAVGHSSILNALRQTIYYTPLFFFAGVMLTEPLTQPQGRYGRIIYGLLIGWLFVPKTHIGSFYFTPELALLAGNLYAYFASPKGRHIFKLINKREVGQGIYDFEFETPKQINFLPGQYMEWTLGLKRGDDRGNRRYFTLASSPTESKALLGIKFYQDPSRFKQEMQDMPLGAEIIGGALSGDFVLPKNPQKKLVFVAGGIGITPFRSMLKYLIDNNDPRPITVLYSNRLYEEIAYLDILQEAYQKLRIPTFFTLTDQKRIPPNWQGSTGYFEGRNIAEAVPDYQERTFLISGSHNMVTGFKTALLNLGISRTKIKTDFFPGLV